MVAAQKSAMKKTGNFEGKGMATAGIVLGIIALTFSILIVALIIQALFWASFTIRTGKFDL